MQTMKKLRLWHALIALLAVAAYLSEDLWPVHQWLGYGVVGLIAVRLLMAIFGSRQLGLKRFYPHFDDLSIGTLATHPAVSRVPLLGIAFSLLGVAATGVMMDQRCVRSRLRRLAPLSLRTGITMRAPTRDAASKMTMTTRKARTKTTRRWARYTNSLPIFCSRQSRCTSATWWCSNGRWRGFMLLIRQPRKPSPSKPKP